DVQVDRSGSLSSQAFAPEVAASGSTVYVVWHDSRNDFSLVHQDIYFNRSLDGGNTWLPADVRLDVGSAPGAAQSIGPQIAASGSSVCVVWMDSRATASGSGAAAIYCNRSLDGGATWLASDVHIDRGGSTPTCEVPHVAAAGSAMVVTWLEDRSIYSN